jgi:hypothetical protein
MAEDQPSLHIDTDWKKQAQEEKRRLAEQEQKRQEQERATRPTPAVPAAATAAAPGPRSARGARETPPASIGSLVQSIWTQALLYLGELAPSGMEPMLNLDMARHQLDLLGVLEDKTKGNLTPEEQHLLDSILYEARTRFISVASQFL